MRLKILLISVLPMAPLIEAILVPPYLSPKYLEETSTVPFLQAALFIFFLIYGILWKRSIAWEPISGLTALLCVGYSLLSVGSPPNMLFATLVLLAYLLIFLDHDSSDTVRLINSFLSSLVMIVVAVWVVRFIDKGGSIIATRSGANIYAANAVESLILLGYTMNIVANRTRKDWIWLGALSLMSALFISRTGLVSTALIILSWMVIYAAQRPKQILAVATLTFAFVSISLVALQSYVEAIMGRFGFLGDGETFIRILERQIQIQTTMQRGLIWSDAIAAIKEYPFLGVGIGEFKNYGGFTSAHNIILNNFTEFGLLFGTYLNLVLLSPFIKLWGVVNRRDRMFAIIVFSVFLLKAVVAGQKLIQSTGYISAFFLVLLFGLFSVLSSVGRRVREEASPEEYSNQQHS